MTDTPAPTGRVGEDVLGIPRTIFEPEHELFRDGVRRFIEEEIAPHHDQWEENGKVSREVWLKAGAAGLLCCGVAEEYGGPGGDFLYDSIVLEELGRSTFSGPGFDLHSCIVAPYLVRFASEDLKRHWLPRMASGEAIGSIGLTEPDCGSDLLALRTSAVRDGDHYVVNGAKTFITNGIKGDLILLAVRTDKDGPARRGISILLVDADSPGYIKGRTLKKIGLKAADTAELFFEDLRVPAANLIGEEGEGWRLLTSELVQERLIVAVRAMAACEAALEMTVDYTRDRKAFGQTVFDFQNTRFTLAELASEIQVGRVYVDRCIELRHQGQLDMRSAAMAKLWVTEMQDKVLDACLQLHGGSGYMWESPIARLWADSRIHRIYAGTNEIMKEIISRGL